MFAPCYFYLSLIIVWKIVFDFLNPFVCFDIVQCLLSHHFLLMLKYEALIYSMILKSCEFLNEGLLSLLSSFMVMKCSSQYPILKEMMIHKQDNYFFNWFHSAHIIGYPSYSASSAYMNEFWSSMWASAISSWEPIYFWRIP